MKKIALLFVAIVGALLLSSGIALAATISCKANVECFGTKGADTLEGTGGPDRMFGRGGADTLKGFGSDDILNGQRGRDTLSGGSEVDYLIGGAGNDTLKGGGGADFYFFGPGWGKESITDDMAPGTEIRFFSDQLQGMPVTENLIVDLRSGSGPEAKNTSATNTIDWDGNVVDNVFSGTGDDLITGDASANLIIGNRGDDTIFGGEGDDEIRLLDQSSGDTVHCGPGEDTVLYDITDPVGVLHDSVDLGDCEHRIANP